MALSALDGLPGVGKTALAITLAYDEEIRQHFSHGILWAGVGPTPHLLEFLSRWGALLGLPSAEIARLSSLEAWTIALRSAISTRSMLLIIDDAWRIEDALALRVGGPNCAYLLTTRSAILALQFANEGVSTVNELSEKESMLLLEQLVPAAIRVEPEAAHSLVRAVGGLPLAITLMGNYLRTQAHSGQTRRIRAALDRLSKAEERLRLTVLLGSAESHPSLLSGVPISLQSVIDASVQKLDEQVRTVLHALAVFPAKPNSFSEEAALDVTGCRVEDLDALSDAGLLEGSGEDRYCLHQTIADYAATRQVERPLYERLVSYAIAFVGAHVSDYPGLERENATILVALEAAYKLGMHNALVEGIYAFAPYLLMRGRYTQAEQHLRRARASILENSDQNRHARILRYLGQAVSMQGAFHEAETILQEGLALARQGEHTAEVSAILTTLGSLWMKQGAIAQGEAAFQESLTLARQLGDYAEVNKLMRNLGVLAGQQGYYAQAISHLQEGLSLARSRRDQELTASILNNLGVAAHQTGNLRGAMTYYREGLSLARQLGYMQLAVALLTNMSVVAGQQGNYSEAEAYLREGLSIVREIGDQEWMGYLVLNLGETAIEQKDLDEAKCFLQEALTIGRQLGHGELTAASLMKLGEVTAELGDLELAEQLLQEGLEVAQNIKDAHLTCRAILLRGELALQQQQFEAAEAAFREMLEHAPEESVDLLAAAQYGLARILAAQGNMIEARQLAESSLKHFERAEHKDRLLVRTWLEQQGTELPPLSP